METLQKDETLTISGLLDCLPRYTDETNLPDWCQMLCKYYERNERHSYSEITAYIFQKDGGIEYVREIVPVLQKIHENMADEVVRKKMGKMIDHINLELVRYDELMVLVRKNVEQRYTEMMNESITRFQQTNEQIESKLKETEKLVEAQKEETEKIKKRTDEIRKSTEEIKKTTEEVSATALEAEDKVKSVQTENVAVLGIFASIVFAFTGLMTFSNSIFENISTASAYRVLFVALITGFIFMNVIGVLIDGVKVIIHWKTSRTVKWAFQNFIKDNLVMFIGDVLILLLLVGVWYRWENSSEKTAQDLSRQRYIQDFQNDNQESEIDIREDRK